MTFRADQLEVCATTSRKDRNCFCVRSRDVSRPLRDRPRAQSGAIDSIDNRRGWSSMTQSTERRRRFGSVRDPSICNSVRLRRKDSWGRIAETLPEIRRRIRRVDSTAIGGIVRDRGLSGSASTFKNWQRFVKLNRTTCPDVRRKKRGNASRVTV